jgi:hypothetical protein
LFKAVLDGADLAGAFLDDAQIPELRSADCDPELAIGVPQQGAGLQRLDPAQGGLTVVAALPEPRPRSEFSGASLFSPIYLPDRPI